MTSAPIVVLVLQKESAVKDYRTFMEATNPETAENGTLRYENLLLIDQIDSWLD